MVSIIINRNPTRDNELTDKENVDDELNKSSILRCNPSLQNYLKVAVRNNIYNLTLLERFHITDATIIKKRKQGEDLLQQWKIECNDKKEMEKNKLCEIFIINNSDGSKELASYKRCIYI